VFECGRCFRMNAVPAAIDRTKPPTAKWAEGNDWLRLTSDDHRQVWVCLMGALRCVGLCWRR
jgi:hypothetical protein